MNRPPRNAVRIASTARSSRCPPATRISGSRFPCTADRRLQAIPGDIQRNRPVYTDGIDPGLLRRSRSRRKPAPFGKPMMRIACAAFRTARTISAVGAMHQRSKSSSFRTPAQLSKICTTSAPALIWPTSDSHRCLDKPVDQDLEHFRLFRRHQPRRRLVRCAAAGYHIGRDRPRRPAEADQRQVVIKQFVNPLDRLENRRKPFRHTCRRQGWRLPPHRSDPAAVLHLRQRQCSDRSHRAPSGCPKRQIAASTSKRLTGCNVIFAARTGSRQRSRNEPAAARKARYSGR